MGWFYHLLIRSIKKVVEISAEIISRNGQQIVIEKNGESKRRKQHKDCNLYRTYCEVNPLINYDDELSDSEFCPKFFATLGKEKATEVRRGYSPSRSHGMSSFAGRVPPFGRLGTHRDLETLKVSAFLEIYKIAGLVRGAHQGEGLGNNFLSHMRAVDGIFHVLRDKQLKLEHEICLKVSAFLEIYKIAGLVRGAHQGEGLGNNFLSHMRAVDGIFHVLRDKQLKVEHEICLKVNMTEKDYQGKKNKFLPMIHAWVQEHGGEQIFPFSGAFERNLADMPEDEAARYCEENKDQSGITKTGFSAIILIYFFTAGPDEVMRFEDLKELGSESTVKVKCWQIRRQTKAPQAAGTIHTDFERGFICAEVMRFEDLKELGSESTVKAAGKYRHEGKTNVVQDGDIICFKFNVPGGGKK